MRGAKTTRKIGFVILVLATCLIVTSCGKSGSIYGSVTWQYLAYGTIGGFPPASTIIAGDNYLVSAGTYQVQFYIFDGTYYWPGGATSPTEEWNASYTVTANPGSIPFVNGQDSYFSLYLTESGMVESGSVKSIRTATQGSNSATPTPAPQTWTQDGLTITVTNQVVALGPDDIARLQQSKLKSK